MFFNNRKLHAKMAEAARAGRPGLETHPEYRPPVIHGEDGLYHPEDWGGRPPLDIPTTRTPEVC